MEKYTPTKIEKKWQKFWQEKGIYKAEDSSKKPKYYALVEFPYPSGAGLHTGHIRSYTGMDIIARKRRMQGYNVLYPMGWDAFGLPTENYAIKTGQAPQKVTKDNIKTFRRQLQSLGYSFDWSREINTTDPQYYKWTQWMFLQFFKHGLAYKAEVPINWCPSCKIGLANEEVVAGKCERCGSEVEQKLKAQWMLRITQYADKLLEGLNDVDFLPEIKKAQENWIGKSEGAEIEFPIVIASEAKQSSPRSSRPQDGLAMTNIPVFTTRPDTIFGATYLVIAPEHPALKNLESRIQNLEEVRAYQARTKQKTEQERLAANKEKTGVELKGLRVINHATKEEIPVFVADYVLASYGTGAIMAVPQHDERDHQFAKKFNLPIVDKPLADWDEVLSLTGAKRTVRYKLRDWVFSRQRYWGEPIPLIHCEQCDWQPVPESDLPLELPKIKNYQPREDGQSPLASISKWVNVKCPKCAGPASRETDVMPNWAGSSWYFLRYTDPSNDKEFSATEKMKAWMPVDWYNGGMEHVTLHLLYSRFWNQFFSDIGLVPTPEPYKKRTKHGMILASDGKKMSKSLGNVVNPDQYVKEFGADALRLYEIFMGPFDQAISWDERGILGPARFLEKVWAISSRPQFFIEKTQEPIARKLHQTMQKVSEDIEKMSFNTAISAMMEFVNMAPGKVSKSDWMLFVQVLAPFAPHITEELYDQLSPNSPFSKGGARRVGDFSIHLTPWPEHNPFLVHEATFELVIQVNGKVRATISAQRGITQSQAEELAKSQESIQKWLKNEPKKVIFVKDRLINFIP